MLYCDKIDLSKGIDVAKSNNSKECIICHYCFFNNWFKCQDSVRSADSRCIIHDISKSEAIHILKILFLMIVGIYKMRSKKINIKNYVRYRENLFKPEILESIHFFIDRKSYKDFTRYHPDKSIKILNLYYDELIEILKGMKEKNT